MKNNIKFSKHEIIYLFTKINKKYNIEFSYAFINEYQLLNNSVKIKDDYKELRKVMGNDNATEKIVSHIQKN